jgi:hypothetical protein
MTFRESITVAADPEALFELSQDYSRRLDWDPFLREARLVGGASAAGVGAVARCSAHNGFVMETRYVSYNPPGACAVEMTEGLWFFRSFAVSWRFEPVGPGRTEVSFAYRIVGRPRFLTGLLALVFGRETRRRLRALKRAAESRAAS